MWSVCATVEVVWKPRFLWQWPSAHLHFFWSLVSHFSLDNTHKDSRWGSGLVSLLASQAHQHHGHLTNFWCFGSVGRCQILLENEIRIFKKLVSRRNHEVFQNLLVAGAVTLVLKTKWTNTSRWHCTSNHHRLWKLNTGLQATWAMSFPVLLLLSPGKMPLTTTVAKFLDTSMCGGSCCLDPSLSPFLVKFTQNLESILLGNPHKAAVLSVVVHLFLPHFSLHSTFC